MDVSKLPRLSETKPPEPAPPHPGAPASQPPASAPSRPVDYRGYAGADDRAVVGAEIWFSLIIGLVLVLYTGQFGKYLIAKSTGHEYHTNVTWTSGPNEGQEVPYTQLEGGTFYSDSSIFFFGVAILIGAVAQFAGVFLRKRGFAWFSLVFTALATLYCLIAAAMIYQTGILPLMTLLCVAFGGFAVIYEWTAFRQSR